jgi:hypothetical protein
VPPPQQQQPQQPTAIPPADGTVDPKQVLVAGKPQNRAGSDADLSE